MSYSVLLIDDHALVRYGMRNLLEATGDFKVVGEADSVNAGLHILRFQRVDIAFVDISLPESNGFDIIRIMKKEFASVPVLIYSMHSARIFINQARDAGANGYIMKSDPTDTIIKAAYKVARGGSWFVRESLNVSPHPSKVDSTLITFKELSKREFQVLHLLASGKSVSSIAAELYISVKTASTHRANILKKLHLKNNNEIMIYAFKNGIIDD